MNLLLPSSPALDLAVAPLNWGVIGTGISQRFVQSLHQHTAHRAVAIAARDAERTRRVATQLGIRRACETVEQVMADPAVQAVYIATPHAHHLDVALEAIAAGKPVLVEKPLTTSAQSAELLLRAARNAGVLAMEAMWTRYLPQSHVVRTLVRDGMLGDISFLTADFGFSMPWDPTSRLWSAELGGGSLLDAGIYPLAFASDILGEPAHVAARGTVAAGGVDGSASILLSYPTGATAQLASSLRAVLPGAAHVSGSDGKVSFTSPFFAPGGFQITVGPWGAQRQAHWDHPGQHSDGYAWQAVAFASYLRDARVESPMHPHREVVSTLRVIDEARAQIHQTSEPIPGIR